MSQQTETDKVLQIRAMNDQLRRTLNGGRIVMTDGILALSEAELAEAIQQVVTFDDFSEDNDPYGEHDFGAFDSAGHKIFWKIDYYDTDYRFASPDPTNQSMTARVLTILLASEY